MGIAPRFLALWRSVGLTVRAQMLQRLLLTWALWVVTEWALLVVLSVVALHRGGVRDVALVGVLRLVPAALTAPLVSRLTERIPRGRLVAGVEITWAVLLLAMAAAVGLTATWPLDVLLGLASVASTVLRPSVNALVPEVEHDPARLSAANSTYGLVEALGSLAGPALASVLLSAASARATLLVLALVLAGAARVAAGIRTELQRPARRRGRTVQGFAIWCRTSALRGVYLVFLAQTFVRGILNVLIVADAAHLVGESSGAGLLFAAMGLGGLLGALLALAGVSWAAAPPFVLGMAAWGLPLLALGVFSAPAVAYLAMVAVGAANAVGSAFGYTIVHRFVPDAALGAAFAAFWSSAWAMTALGSYAACWLLAAVGSHGSFALAGGALVVVALASWPALRTVDADLAVDAHALRLAARVPMFAALSRVALEQLVRHARPIQVRRGELVTVQDEQADELFIIDSGRLVALVDGVANREMGTGECFGEIAALLETRRTATVRALVDCRLLAIDGTAFVLAVTGHTRARRAAAELVEHRLGADPVRGPTLGGRGRSWQRTRWPTSKRRRARRMTCRSGGCVAGAGWPAPQWRASARPVGCR